jgi:hypothetical protein
MSTTVTTLGEVTQDVPQGPSRDIFIASPIVVTTSTPYEGDKKPWLLHGANMVLFVVLYQIYKHVGTKHSFVRMQLKGKNGNFNFRIVHPAVNINVDYTIISHTQLSLTRQGNS